MKKKILVLLAVVVIVTLFTTTLGVRIADWILNPVTEHEPFKISEEAAALHASLIVGDWHADTALWNRNMQGRHDVGHVDLARMQEGNLGIQMFTTVTKSHLCQRQHSNFVYCAGFVTLVVLA